jgi:hypothetical protein
MKPGDVVKSDDGRRWKIGPLMAVQGWPGCKSWRCTRIGSTPTDPGECVGYHCPDCGEPTNSFGHKCPERGEA